MSKSRNYYEILGVSRQATREEIKKAYRRLVRKYHPDLNPGDKAAAEKIKKINRAYEILSDPERRNKYDREIQEPEEVKAKPEQPLDAAGLYKQGFKKTQRKDYKGAIANYTEALRLDPNFTEAYNMRGFARFQLRDYQGAFADYSKALQLDSKATEVYYYRGLARFKLASIEGAIEDYTKALQLNANYAPAYYQRGLAYADIENIAAALADLKKAAQLFSQQQQGVNARQASEAFRRLEKKYAKGIVSAYALLALPQDTLKAVQTFAFNPMGGLLPAFSKLESSKAIAVGSLLALIFDICFVLGLSAGGASLSTLILFGIFPFIGFTGASALVRLILGGSGSFAGDAFIAGASLLPASALLLASLVLVNSLPQAIAVLAVFAASHTILTLYSGCNQISNLSETQSAIAVPIILLLGSLPLTFIN